MSDSLQHPYKTLGLQIKTMRQSRHESLAEVSGSLEMDVELLKHIEQGLVRPSLDTLELLTNHFDLSDKEAYELWSLAGYENHSHPHGPDFPDESLSRQLMVVLPMDSRIVYTDSIQVVVGKNGVTINFMQQSTSGKPVVVSRVGMSKDHAKNVVEMLQRTLDQNTHSHPKLLPPQATHEP